jgi:16S rRNA (guanine966-N2)-methyltransferase
LQFRVRDAVVLDLYAGSGVLGIEALSRGAAHVVFNDRSGDCRRLIEENLRTLHLMERATVLTMDAETALAHIKNCGLQFDIAFLDPPYLMGAQGALEKLFLFELIKADGIAAVEHKWEAPPAAVPGRMRITDQRRYGDTGIRFFETDRTAD